MNSYKYIFIFAYAIEILNIFVLPFYFVDCNTQSSDVYTLSTNSGSENSQSHSKASSCENSHASPAVKSSKSNSERNNASQKGISEGSISPQGHSSFSGAAGDSYGDNQTVVNLGKHHYRIYVLIFIAPRKVSIELKQIQMTINPIDLDTAKASSTSSNRQALLPWGTQSRSCIAATSGILDMQQTTDSSLRPGEIVMRILFADFTQQAEKKIESVMLETVDKNLAKVLQRGEDPQFDQLLSSFGSVAEHCLPSLLMTLLAWHRRQLSDAEIKNDLKRMEKIVTKSNIDIEMQLQKRESAVEFIFCLALIEVLKQLPFHPGHENIVKNIENLAFKHFKYRDG